MEIGVRRIGTPQKLTLGPGDIGQGEKALSKRPKADTQQVGPHKAEKNPANVTGKPAPEVKDAPAEEEGPKFNETV